MKQKFQQNMAIIIEPFKKKNFKKKQKKKKHTHPEDKMVSLGKTVNSVVVVAIEMFIVYLSCLLIC